MGEDAPLLVLTRPSEEQAARVGDDVLHLPLIELGIAEPSAQLTAQLQWANSAQLLIFVSRYAVECAWRLAPGLGQQRHARWCAVGPATAQRLQELFEVEVLQPAAQQSNSEGLLARLPEVKAMHCALFAAPDGRTVLREGLLRRGAIVEQIEVYRRRPVAPSTAQLSTLLAQRHRLIFSATSVQLLHGVHDLLARLHMNPAQTTLVVSAPRIAQAAQALGFARILHAEGADLPALRRALAHTSAA